MRIRFDGIKQGRKSKLGLIVYFGNGDMLIDCNAEAIFLCLGELFFGRCLRKINVLLAMSWTQACHDQSP